MGKLKTFKQYYKRYYLIFVLQFGEKIETLRYVKKNSFEYSVRDVRITGTTKYSVSFSSLSFSFRLSLPDLEKSACKSHHTKIFLNLGHLLVCLRKKTSFTAPGNKEHSSGETRHGDTWIQFVFVIEVFLK